MEVLDKKLVKEFTETQQQIAKVQNKMNQAVVSLKEELTTLQEKETQLKEAVKASMEKHGVTKFENEAFKITYIAPTVRNTIDVTRLKEEKPEIAKEYTKQSKVKSSIRITVKEIA